MKRHSLISIIGETNSGKSTLMNKLVDDKISIVSHKVQTTRNQILGVYTHNDNQIVFIDTPGVFLHKNNKDSFLIRVAYGSLLDADVIIVLIDATKGITSVLKTLLKRLELFKDKNIILVLNKIDLFNKSDKAKLLTLSKELYDYKIFKEVFMISALKSNGIEDLLSYLEKHLYKEGWLFDNDITSNISLNFWSTEITREKIFKYVHQELPYMISVKLLMWQETDKQIIIKQDIIVSKTSHKKIVVGKGGGTIKRISMESKKELERYLEKKIHLYLFVKVDPKLMDKKDLFVNEDILLSKDI